MTHNYLIKFLQNVDIPDFDIRDLLRRTSDQPINIAVAMSGGGYRSMLTSSGFLLGMDHYGLFDCTSYLASISGGSWTLMKLILMDFKVNELRKWDINSSLLEGVPNFEINNRDIIQQLDLVTTDHDFLIDDTFYDELRKLEPKHNKVIEPLTKKRSLDSILKLKETFGDVFKSNNQTANNVTHVKKFSEMLDSFLSFRKVLGFYINLHSEVKPKKIMGFPVSFTDYWGRALWKKIHNSKTTMSSMSDLFLKGESGKAFKAPIPIIVANCKNEELTNIVFEFTPFEFGTWNRVLKLFVELKYLGSKIVRGISHTCINGFDDIGFIAATSSSLFNNVLVYAWQLAAGSSQETIRAVRALFSTFGVNVRNQAPNATKVLGTRSDFALFQPNPFLHYPGVDSPLTDIDRLYLVDGGEDGENIPIRPFLQPERAVDFIFALDSSSGKFNYPTGGILRNIYENIHHEDDHATIIGQNGIPINIDLMPYIPQNEVFDRKGLLKHPVAFGCHLSSFSVRNSSTSRSPGRLPPIILYHANYNHTYKSNTSTFKLSYDLDEVSGMLDNGENILSNDQDPDYLRCVGCLIIKRAYDNTDTTNLLPVTCIECFMQYCYN